MTERLHGLRLPDTTSCGRVGRSTTLGARAAIVQGDRTFRIAPNLDAINCAQCLERIRRHGLSLSWPAELHPASIDAHKRRRHRRRSTRNDP